MSAPIGQPLPWQVNFQDAASPIMEGLHDMHNLLLCVITGIALTVLVLLGYIFYKFHHKRHPTPYIFTHNSTLEVIWTIVPVFILVVIGIPSIRLLHKIETPVNADITIKAIGHQWYWSYEYPDEHNPGQYIEFDSYMLQEHGSASKTLVRIMVSVLNYVEKSMGICQLL